MKDAERMNDCAQRDSEDIGINPSRETNIGEIIATRLSRRQALVGLTASAAVGALGGGLAALHPKAALAQSASTLTFVEIPHGYDGKHHAPAGYTAQVLLRWGDKVIKDAPAFDPRALTAASQAQQFGYNCDFLCFMPLPQGSRNGETGLLWVNHEYTNAELMWPGITPNNAAERLAKEQVDVELAAHGGSLVEIRKAGGQWQIVGDSRYNRRVTGMTPIRISGPVAGHARMKTAADPSGTQVLGMVNNCGGGVTPWGTVLTCEENFNGYFAGTSTGAEAANHKRYGIAAASRYAWSRHHERFDISKHPTEPNRFGWVVEIDPYDPNWQPVKRTALGRTKHEGAGTALNADGRVVVYTGDDERFDYLYKFVSAGRYNPTDRAANRDLLDSGTLYVARFNDDGTLAWLPLVFGEGQLTAANGFNSQADVLIETRRAADLLKATPMDRPEDVDVSPLTGRVYMALTNNTNRRPEQLDKANPRPSNKHGHIIEMIPPGTGTQIDHAATTFRWDILLMAGNPAVKEDAAQYHPGTSAHGWLSCPDNLAFDAKGHLWIATDGAPGTSKIADGVYGCDTSGSGRALTRLFFAAPSGAELASLFFGPDNKTAFFSVQHPGEEGESTFDKPQNRWPDNNPNMPPRPSVVAVMKTDGGDVGA